MKLFLFVSFFRQLTLNNKHIKRTKWNEKASNTESQNAKHSICGMLNIELWTLNVFRFIDRIHEKCTNLPLSFVEMAFILRHVFEFTRFSKCPIFVCTLYSKWEHITSLVVKLILTPRRFLFLSLVSFPYAIAAQVFALLVNTIKRNKIENTCVGCL